MLISDMKKNELRDLFSEKISFGEPLAGFTSMGVGGPAEALFIPSSTLDIQNIMEWCSANEITWHILGGGTNMVIMDDGMRGIVIAITRTFSGFSHAMADASSVRLRINAGTTLSSICNWAADHGMQGLEFAAGIPGTFGGAVKMNAGTSEGRISDILETVTVITPDGKICTVDKKGIEAQYRKMSFKGLIKPGDSCGSIITGASIILKKGLAEEIKTKIRKSVELRKTRQPLGQKNAGCIFRNPENAPPAGKLIEMAGLKGTRSGGAKISEVHANFIVNTGDAKASDILGLIETIKTGVLEKFDIRLEPEVIIAG